MVLIKCVECGREVSDKASACPSCGHPINTGAITTVQRTNKTWKIYSLIALGCFATGLFFVFLGNEYAIIGSILLLVALILGISAKVGAWWTNS